MTIKERITDGYRFLRDSRVELRLRLLAFCQAMIVMAFLIGTLSMALLGQSFRSIIPNIILFIFGAAGIYLSYVRKKYEAAVIVTIVGCANITLPIMFFMAGGNNSGMPVWFIFAIVLECMMANGRFRIFATAFTTIEYVLCMAEAYYYPELVTPFSDSEAAFWDLLQSLVVVSVGICILIGVHLNAYENQRRRLELQSKRLAEITRKDELTGLLNRHAYYEDIAALEKVGYRDDMVLVAMDVNGLKVANDQFGHSAGDRLLRTSAEVMRNAFSAYGEIYRTGGDEFMAILFCDPEAFVSLGDRLEHAISVSEEVDNGKVSIAKGIVAFSGYSDYSFTALERRADELMYRDKDEYYRREGIDRRKI